MIEQLEENIVSLEEIRAVERELRVSFPQSYVRFLLEYNGGSPTDPLVKTEDGRPLANVMSFYSVTSSLFRQEVEGFRDLVDEGLLPIADSGSGDRWFLDVKTGRIRFWEHEIHLWNTDVDAMPAVVRGIETFVEQLAENQPAVRLLTTREDDLVAYLAEKGTVEEVEAYLSAHDVESEDDDGATILEGAGFSGNLPVFKLCFEAGAELRRGATMASSMGHVEVLQYLLDQGWDINTKDPDGRRAIDTVIDMDTRKFLMDRGSAPPSGVGFY